MSDAETSARHLLDLCRRAERIGSWQFSAFLTLAEQDEFALSPLSDGLPYHFWGGTEWAERKILATGDAELSGPPDYPLVPVRVSPVSARFAEELEHRDFLGALMNLGISRNLLGDLYVRDHQAVFFCLDAIADYLLSSLTSVRRTPVTASAVSPEDELLQPIFREICFTVASERLDAIVTGFASLSRGQAAQLFPASRVLVNGRVETSPSGKLKPGDILTVRGTGKAIYQGITRETRKGRLLVSLKQYA